MERKIKISFNKKKYCYEAVIENETSRYEIKGRELKKIIRNAIVAEDFKKGRGEKKEPMPTMIMRARKALSIKD